MKNPVQSQGYVGRKRHMKKGIALFLTLALTLGLVTFAPLSSSAAASRLSAATSPSEPLSDEVLTETYTALYALESMHMDMDVTVEMNMDVSYSGQKMSVPMSILMRLEADEQKNPIRIRGQMHMDANTMGKNQQMSALLYAEQADGVITAYASEDDGVSWTTNQTDAPTLDPVQMVSVIVDHSRDFHATGKELVDGNETLVYVGKLDGSFIQQATNIIGSGAVSDLVGEDMTAENLNSLGDIDVAMYIDTKTRLPLRYTMDMSELMKNLMGTALQSLAGTQIQEGYEMNVVIHTAKMECYLKDFNAVSPIEIPEAARASLTPQPEPLPIVGGNDVDPSAAIPFVKADEGYRIENTQIQETVLADDENIRIVGKSLSYDPAYQYDFAELNLSIENKTAQKLTVTNELLLVNGFDIMGTMYQEVEPGATVESSLSIDRDVLRRAEIPLIADLWVNFSVSSEDYSLLMNTPLVKLRTDAPEDFVQPLNETGVRLYDDHGVTVIARYLEPWYDTSAQLVLLIENKTDSYTYLATEGVRINGIDVDLFGNEFLSPQSNAISALYIDGDVLGAQNIQRVDAVSLQLTIQIHDAAYTELTTEFIDIPVIY